MPQRPALAIVVMFEQATHSGGCGFCIGLGTTLRAGKSKNSPCHSQRCSVKAGTSARTDSSHTSRLSRTRRPKGCSSTGPCPSPSPSSTRPPESRSSVATRSATRMGWLVGSWMIPWPRRMRCVRCVAAPRNTSGAEQCEYSSRKWCSTHHA